MPKRKIWQVKFLSKQMSQASLKRFSFPIPFFCSPFHLVVFFVQDVSPDFPNPSFVLHALKWFPDLLLLPSRPLPVQPPVPSQTRDPPTPCLPWQVPTLKPNKHRWHHRPAKAHETGDNKWVINRCGIFFIGAPQRYRPTCIPNC